MHLALLPLRLPLYMLIAISWPNIGWRSPTRQAFTDCPSSCRHKPVSAPAQTLSIPTHHWADKTSPVA